MKKLSAKGSKYLKIIHLIFVAIWFGGFMTWYPLVLGNGLTEYESAYTTYLNMRSIAWNVIGWGGIGSLSTGVLLGLFGNWSLFRHRWVAVKFFTVIGLIFFGMFFLEELMLSNIELLEEQNVRALSHSRFLDNHQWIKKGLIFEAVVFVTLVTISVIKPWRKKRSNR